MDECKASFIPHRLSASTTDRKGSVDFKEWCSYLRRGTSDRLWQDRHCVAATFQFVPFPLAPTPYTLASGQIALYKILCLFIAILHYFILLILICEAKTMAIQQNNTSTNINVKWLLIRQNVWVFYVGNISRTLDECCIAQPSTWYLYLPSWNLMFFSCLLGPGNVTGSVCLIKARRKWFDSGLKFRRRVNCAAWKKRQI